MPGSLHNSSIDQSSSVPIDSPLRIFWMLGASIIPVDQLVSCRCCGMAMRVDGTVDGANEPPVDLNQIFFVCCFDQVVKILL
jgi:hypothetical protein